jgi:4'-phosphopantetheinyl transferase
MPLFEEITIEKTTKLLIWKITESFDDFFDSILLTDVSLIRLNNMKSLSHQKGFMAVRMLLQYAGYSDFDLYYDQFGKPHLKDGTTISISHSHEFSVIALSTKNVGIDIEMQRDKIIKIAQKFANETFVYLKKEDSQNYIKKLTTIWGIKEAVFKIKNESGISYKDHVHVQPFEMNDRKCTAILDFNNIIEYYKVWFYELEHYILVIVFQN